MADARKKPATVDRKSRNCLIDAIEKYLGDKITAFEFDEQISAVLELTTDPTVEFVGQELWFFYDDCDDHQVCLTPEAWNYFQRLLLLLRSDYSAEVRCFRVWLPTQLAAAIALAAFAVVAVYVVQHGTVWLALGAFGIVSMLLTAANLWLFVRRKLSPHAAILYPFNSFSELRQVVEDSPKFQKRRYRREIEQLAIRGRLGEAIMWSQFLFAWLACSPAVLAFQMFPKTEFSVSIVRE